MSKYADRIFTSDCIFTAEGEDPFSGYVALKGDRILAVGHGSPKSELLGPGTEICNLGDRTLCPGFTDVHCFFAGYSVGFVGADLQECTSEAELLDRVQAYAAPLPPEKPILCHGWEPSVIPASDSLEALFGDRPVVLFATGCETCWMNAAARKAYHFTPETCWPESYVRLLPQILGDRDFIVPAFKNYMRLMNSRGVTSIKEMSYDRFDGFTDILAELETTDGLTLRVDFMSQPVDKPMDLERMGAMGVVAEIYPQIQSIADRAGKLAMIDEKIGMERGRYYWNRRKMADAGVPLSCGTDLPLLIDDIPASVYYAVGGYFPEGGQAFQAQNTLTTKELLTAWTYGGAYNLGCETSRGTLTPGKLADIAVLSGNLFTTPVENARELKVDLTLVGGKAVYSEL